MQDRIFSIGTALITAGISFTVPNLAAEAQVPGSYVTDPATGIVYRPETRTIETPVVDTQIKKEERVLYRPKTVTDVRNEARTTYAPVVEHQWEPRLHGRWNPFTQPTVAYHHVPVTRWEARNEVIPRTTTRTEWVAEKQVIEIPTRTVRIERSSKTDYVAVGKVAPTASPQQPSVQDQIASRLRPLDSNSTVEPFASHPQQQLGGVSRFASDSPQRGFEQAGIRPTELYPSSGYNQVLPPTNGSGLAGLPALPIWR